MAESEISQLKEVVATLSKEVGRLRDESDVRKLHHKYGYYLDKCLYQEVVDLFADHPDTYVEFLGGRYKGKEGARRLYVGRFSDAFVAGRNGPVHGFLLDHAMLQDIVDVDDSGTHAWARMRTIMSAGTHESIAKTHPRGAVQWWEGGLYENEYIKENGVWKIFKYRYAAFWHGDAAKGWSGTKPNFVPMLEKTYPEDPAGPDELAKDPKVLWPDTRVLPFHYPHPVTGKQVAEDDLRAPEFGKDVSTSAPAHFL